MSRTASQVIPLSFDERVYRVATDIRLICTIEDELGGMPELSQKFNRGGWRISELVALIHIMLQSAGKTVDFMALGDKILHDGIDVYLSIATRFLSPFLPQEHP